MTNKALVLLSGEASSIPLAEAKSLFLTYDSETRFESPEPRILIAEGSGSVTAVARRIAFSRRVGLLLRDSSEAAGVVDGKRVRLRSYSLGIRESTETSDAISYLRGLNAEVDLRSPDYEFTLIRGRKDYLMLSQPGNMLQSWSVRRPRQRPYFHPSAIFPKLSRALVNLTRCREGELFFDPFVGTGSLAIEAASIGLACVALDRSRAMARGSLANMKAFRQSWLGVVQGDAFRGPIRLADGVATDVPYGRASSTGGKLVSNVVASILSSVAEILRPGGRLVLMHPRGVALPETQELIEEEEHYIYVHRKLTRAVTVLRKS